MAVEQLPPHPSIGLLPADELNKNTILDQIIDNIKDYQELFPHVDLNILCNQCEDVKKKDVNQEVQTRQFLQAFKNTSVFKEAFDALDEDTQRKITAFGKGASATDVTTEGFPLPPSPAVKHHFQFLDKLRSFFDGLHNHQETNGYGPETFFFHKDGHKAPIIYEDPEQKKIMKAYSEAPFSNWGENIKHTPKYTFVPSTVLGVQNVIKFCKDHNLRVRCGGYRHSWSSSYSEQGEVLISLLDLHAVTRIPDPLALGVETGVVGNELATINRLVKPGWGAPDKEYVRVGSAVTSEAFRKWSIKNNVVALPMDAILVEVTMGGLNGPLCHGAGRRFGTMSDQVRAIEYVDANGVTQTVTDTQQLRAAAGCFGLLGVVTHITFELDSMVYAVLKPEKVPVGLAIPPLQLSDIPPALRKNPGPTQEQLQAAQAKFENSATNDYYAEWFWFTYQSTAWVNCWNTVTDSEGVKDHPSPPGVFIQWLGSWIGGWFSQTYFFQHIPAHWQAQFLAIAGMAVLPPTTFDKPSTKTKTYLPDGLHFQRGIQNFRVRDLEFQIPLPPQTSDPSKPDLRVLQRAWWDVINLVYEEAAHGRSPMRLTLECRIMGGSDMLMAAQRGNECGTASIEVLTVPNADPDDWEAFKQRVVDRWMAYEDAQGKRLNVRPHWAKEWNNITIQGMPIRKYLKTTAYKDAIPEFKRELAAIGDKQGWTLKDIQNRFSNEMWDEIIYS